MMQVVPVVMEVVAVAVAADEMGGTEVPQLSTFDRL